MRTFKTRARLVVAAICSVAVLQANADVVRYYREGSVPDPQVVASILGGQKPGHGLKMRGSSAWNAPVEQMAVRDGGQNVGDDAIALREETINGNARSAVADWQQRQMGGKKPTLALAEPASVAQPAPVAQPPATARPAALAIAITFANDSAQLPPESTPSLDAVAAGIKMAGFKQRVVVEGHTSATGSLKHNLRLSKLRAESVKRYLVTRQGIPATALRTVGMGSRAPLDKHNPYAAENRRVQFRVAA